MKIIELSSKESKDGKRKVKVILHEIYKDKSQYNKNGITWLEEYCKENLDSIKGTSITCEFINEERTEILGHGETGIEDGIPVFENATMIGVLEHGYIDNIEIDGETKKVCIAEGHLDAMRYKNFIDVLERRYLGGETISGSVEIIGRKENDNKIKYLEGYKEKGRIPTEFRYSGFAILGVEPSDDTARLIEINKINKKNSREEDLFMDDFKEILQEIKSRIDKTSECRKELDERKHELNEAKESETKLLEKLDTLQAEKDELTNRLAESTAKLESLEKELEKVKAKGLINDLEEALKDFSDEQKKPLENEIREFKNDPINSELKIEEIVEKILAEIGKRLIESEKESTHEQNSFKFKNEDIFGEVVETSSETLSIF